VRLVRNSFSLFQLLTLNAACVLLMLAGVALSVVQAELRELQVRSGELQRREAEVASSQSRLEAAAAAVARERQAVARERAQLQVCFGRGCAVDNVIHGTSHCCAHAVCVSKWYCCMLTSILYGAALLPSGAGGAHG
jgi:hypothetical protein